MDEPILGKDHATAIASDPLRNPDFRPGLLGLRLVGTTVDFEDRWTYHRDRVEEALAEIRTGGRPWVPA